MKPKSESKKKIKDTNTIPKKNAKEKVITPPQILQSHVQVQMPTPGPGKSKKSKVKMETNEEE